MPDLCCVIHESNYIQLMHCFSVWHLPAFTVYQVAGTRNALWLTIFVLCYMITLVIWTRGLNSIWVARYRHSQGDLGGNGHSKIFIKYSHFVPWEAVFQTLLFTYNQTFWQQIFLAPRNFWAGYASVAKLSTLDCKMIYNNLSNRICHSH